MQLCHCGPFLVYHTPFLGRVLSPEKQGAGQAPRSPRVRPGVNSLPLLWVAAEAFPRRAGCLAGFFPVARQNSRSLLSETLPVLRFFCPQSCARHLGQDVCHAI